MSKLWAGLIIFLLSCNANAGWENIAHSKSDGGFQIFVNKDSIRKANNLVKMWVMFDFESPRNGDGFKYLSQRNHTENDCINERVRILFYTLYSGQKSEGDSVETSSNPGQWLPISPDTVDALTWSIACG